MHDIIGSETNFIAWDGRKLGIILFENRQKLNDLGLSDIRRLAYELDHSFLEQNANG